MAGKDIIIMRSKEFSRVSVIGSVINNKITQLEAANILGLSTRQIRRIERSFKTHQDRLVKEMELKKICTIKEANKFLNNYYIPKHNRKFAVKAINSTDLHRLIPKGLDLDRIFCIKKKAALRNDFTIQYNNRFYQILDVIRAKEVTIEEHFNGKLYIYHKDTQLKYKLIDKRPQKPKQPYKLRKPRYVLPKDHPYRLFKIKKAS